ncbi:hypothetical protein ANN_24102 [Periplaneta americana]|uniref:Uncharacterized protein n=1 Tax=Periplaneta americana TaxID=6978 RepID=A0ABQ8S2D4_PERAM|nr:hypothetical protein ANN_24102 [Periplaneta americana]
MAGLCEGGNEPAGSLKAIYGYYASGNVGCDDGGGGGGGGGHSGYSNGDYCSVGHSDDCSSATVEAATLARSRTSGLEASGEGWARCMSCMKWAHEEFSGLDPVADDDFICGLYR